MIPDRLQHLCYGLLDEPIEHCRYAEQSDTSLRLVDFLLPYRLREVSSGQEVGFDFRPVPSKVPAQLGGFHAIDAGCAFVLFDPAQGLSHVLPLTDGLHEPDRSSRTFGQSFCYESILFPWKFTFRYLSQVQLRLHYLHKAMTPTCLSHLADPSVPPTVRTFDGGYTARPIRSLRLSTLECLTSPA